RVARQQASARAVRQRILDDDLPRAVGGAVQELGRRLLVPSEACEGALTLEEQLVLAPCGARREDERADGAARVAEEERCVVLERPAGEGAEVGEQLDERLARHVL